MRGKRADDETLLGSGGGDEPGYDPNQPRVPAGHPDGGQWTKSGARAAAVALASRPHDNQASFGGFENDEVRSDRTNARIFSHTANAAAVDQYRDRAEPSVEVWLINGTGVGTNLGWRRYAEVGGLSSEDQREVEETTEILRTLLFRVNSTISRAPGLTPQQYGTLVRTTFAIAVKALKLPEHLRHLTLQVEQSFDKSGTTRYGQPGSIRTDVLLRNAQGTIIAIYERQNRKRRNAAFDRAEVSRLHEGASLCSAFHFARTEGAEMNSLDTSMAGKQETIIATRILKLRRPNGYVDLPVHIFAPTKKGEEWFGRVEIGWPGTPQPIAVNGCVDAIEVLETSMRLIGAVLYSCMPHLTGELVWQQPGNGYGFPVLEDMRELLQGEDRRF